ncbi:hypothetical protein GMORB2_3304 [Geosmithia morbida]|uniref:Uncharacterized protein n=1 Tax=Geosmithia morbida TaxID=1094350 RepID=A0A9P4YPH6_9HYPO|nr:uncharacterized protein GMORB2_3304 [Geosmithia morbida]KAF4120177.1 hypothetical protein GMORB2_3304 [Geosmithia morbida]
MAEATSSVSNSGRRLTYADPRDLPSFPSSGLPSDGAAAGAAATLGWHSHSKSADMTKSDQLSSASAAAVLSRDARKSSTSTPSSESAGHQAALLAVGSASSALKHQSSNSSSTRDQHEGWGTSAATQAFHAIRSTPRSSNNLSPGNTAATQAFNTNRSLSAQVSRASSSISDADRSLAAAKGAMASARPRSTSTPTAGGSAKPASTHSRAYSNALDGASIAHRSSVMSKASIEDTGAVPVTTMTRNMFTSNPKVKLEIDEQKNTDRLRLSAIEMARKMYTLQQAQGNDNGGDSGNSSQAPPYTNLQDAAYRQAQDRLAKLDNSYTRNRDMQEYYGNPKMPKRHFSVSHRLRRKNSDDYVSDRRESERIRQQMSMFSNKLTEVDETKRENDRDALLAAAQRNVKARLQDMDEKVFSETGMVSPSLSKDWGTKVHDAAKNRIVSSSDQDKDRRDLGGGMFMDQEQIDAIAAMRMQPVLDDLNEKAEKERERLATLKAEEDARKGELARQKEREREAKEFNKKIRGKFLTQA